MRGFETHPTTAAPTAPAVVASLATTLGSSIAADTRIVPMHSLSSSVRSMFFAFGAFDSLAFVVPVDSFFVVLVPASFFVVVVPAAAAVVVAPAATVVGVAAGSSFFEQAPAPATRIVLRASAPIMRFIVFLQS